MLVHETSEHVKRPPCGCNWTAAFNCSVLIAGYKMQNHLPLQVLLYLKQKNQDLDWQNMSPLITCFLCISFFFAFSYWNPSLVLKPWKERRKSHWGFGFNVLEMQVSKPLPNSVSLRCGGHSSCLSVFWCESHFVVPYTFFSSHFCKLKCASVMLCIGSATWSYEVTLCVCHAHPAILSECQDTHTSCCIALWYMHEWLFCWWRSFCSA